MTDLEIVAFLNLNDAEAAIVIPKITAQQRALYDRMRKVELYARGLGPRPAGVMVDLAKPKRK